MTVTNNQNFWMINSAIYKKFNKSLGLYVSSLPCGVAACSPLQPNDLQRVNMSRTDNFLMRAAHEQAHCRHELIMPIMFGVHLWKRLTLCLLEFNTSNEGCFFLLDSWISFCSLCFSKYCKLRKWEKKNALFYIWTAYRAVRLWESWLAQFSLTSPVLCQRA